MILTYQEATDLQQDLIANYVNNYPGDDEFDDDDDLYDNEVPEDEEDDLLQDDLETENDLNEIRVGDDLGEPDPEDDDHLPEEELQ